MTCAPFVVTVTPLTEPVTVAKPLAYAICMEEANDEFSIKSSYSSSFLSVMIVSAISTYELSAISSHETSKSSNVPEASELPELPPGFVHPSVPFSPQSSKGLSALHATHKQKHTA